MKCTRSRSRFAAAAVAAAIALAFPPASAALQNPGDSLLIAGAVVDSASQQPIAGAQVVIRGPRIIGAITDRSGRFKFHVPASLTFPMEVYAQYIGYVSQNRVISSSDALSNLHFALSQAGIRDHVNEIIGETRPLVQRNRTLLSSLEPGRPIRVLVDSDRDFLLVGRVHTVDSSALLVIRRMDRPPYPIRWVDIRRIDVAIPNPERWKHVRVGALVGVGVGLGSFLWIAAQLDDACRDCPNSNSGFGGAAAGASFTIAGGLLGAGIGRLTVPAAWEVHWTPAPVSRPMRLP